jgi:hypothetical protein
LLLPDKFKPLGITKYDAKQDPIQWLRCYALSIENASGNNGNQRSRNNNNYSGPNRKCKPDNTVAAIQRPAKEN